MLHFSRFRNKIGVFARYICENPHWVYPSVVGFFSVQITPAALMHEVVPSAVIAALMAAATSCSTNLTTFLVCMLMAGTG